MPSSLQVFRAIRDAVTVLNNAAAKLDADKIDKDAAIGIGRDAAEKLLLKLKKEEE